MDIDQFRCVLAAIDGIDHGMLPELDGSDWQSFRSNPARFFLHCADIHKDAIWREVSTRMPGATGTHPEGKDTPDDEGGLKIAVTTTNKGEVRIDFGKAVAWFSLPPMSALRFCRMILIHAGVKIA